MRDLNWLTMCVELSIDLSSWEENGIDWQEVADDLMNYDDKLSADEFLAGLAELEKRGAVEFVLGGWVLNHKLLWC